MASSKILSEFMQRLNSDPEETPPEWGAGTGRSQKRGQVPRGLNGGGHGTLARESRAVSPHPNCEKTVGWSRVAFGLRRDIQCWGIPA